MTGQDSGIEALLGKQEWHEERKKLRSLVLDSGLEETVKWGKLCFSHEGNNVAIIQCMKNYCAVGFFKGALLEDACKALVSPGRHSQAMRQLRYASLEEIVKGKDVLANCLAEAVQLEKDGREVAFTAKDNLSYPQELQQAFKKDSELEGAFARLTPGRQRGYILHFSDAKQSATRAARIEKSRQKILEGKGVNGR